MCEDEILTNIKFYCIIIVADTVKTLFLGASLRCFHITSHMLCYIYPLKGSCQQRAFGH